MVFLLLISYVETWKTRFWNCLLFESDDILNPNYGHRAFWIQVFFKIAVRCLLLVTSHNEFKSFLKKHCHYTGSLAPADLSGAVFNHAHFQKIAKISSLCDFYYISEGIPLLLRFGLLMTYVLRIWVMWIFARPKKTHKLRTGCMYILAIPVVEFSREGYIIRKVFG